MPLSLTCYVCESAGFSLSSPRLSFTLPLRCEHFHISRSHPSPAARLWCILLNLVPTLMYILCNDTSGLKTQQHSDDRTLQHERPLVHKANVRTFVCRRGPRVDTRSLRTWQIVEYRPRASFVKDSSAACSDGDPRGPSFFVHFIVCVSESRTVCMLRRRVAVFDVGVCSLVETYHRTRSRSLQRRKEHMVSKGTS